MLFLLFFYGFFLFLLWWTFPKHHCTWCIKTYEHNGDRVHSWTRSTRNLQWSRRPTEKIKNLHKTHELIGYHCDYSFVIVLYSFNKVNLKQFFGLSIIQYAVTNRFPYDISKIICYSYISTLSKVINETSWYIIKE